MITVKEQRMDIKRTAEKAADGVKKAGKTAFEKGKSVREKISEQTKFRTSEIIDERILLMMLDDLYRKALTGIPKAHSGSVDELASVYMRRYPTDSKAARSLITAQIAKCGASGFLTGLGGFITMPVTMPANISSLMYMQIRMAAAVAKIGGFDISTEETKALVYVCLTGKDAPKILAKIHTETAQKFTAQAADVIPNKVLGSMGHKMDFRFIAKFILKNMVKSINAVPIAGGVFGGAMDVASTKTIGDNAYDLFILRELPVVHEEEKQPEQ
ncbi:EcsC family protein [Ruminococcus sp. YE71]|uniref:EcsC family protein n=2 Tax=unclassified Ruminococcus TaxID=2608920 RepID=UPI0009FBC5B6|nr:EcsC family protein [Ruminococcus sp. YE71]